MEELPEILDPSAYPYALRNLEAEQLARFARNNIMNGGLKILRLVTRDAETHVRPSDLVAKFTEQEGEAAATNMKSALYELGDLSGSAIVEGVDGPQPFSLSMVVPRLLLVFDRGASLQIVPSNPTNIIAVHEGLFLLDDTDTRALVNFLKINDTDSATDLCFTLELPGTSVEQLPQINDRLAALGTEYGYKLRAKKMDLATALQSAVQRALTQNAATKKVLLNTTAKGPNGGNILVVSFPREQIQLREEVLIVQEVSTPRSLMGLTSVVIERPLL